MPSLHGNGLGTSTATVLERLHSSWKNDRPRKAPKTPENMVQNYGAKDMVQNNPLFLVFAP